MSINNKRTYKKVLSQTIMNGITNEIYQKEKKKRLNPNSDTENRKRVMERIAKYRKKGVSQEEAIDLIMQDKEVLEQFNYLTKNGLDMKQCILNWSNNIYRKQTNSLEKER